MKKNKRLTVMALITGLILLIPLIAMQFTDKVKWGVFDFVLMAAVLSGIAVVYELVARRPEKTVYRVAFGFGLAGAFLLFWVNGAVGIIGSENQPANLLYGAVFAVGLIGSLISRLRPRGMARTLFTAALVQLLIPGVAVVIWPQLSWGGAGVIGVFILNAFFAMIFVASGLFFRQAGAH